LHLFFSVLELRVCIVVSSAAHSVLILRVSTSVHIRLAAAAAPPPPKTLATTTTHFRIATITIPTTAIDRCHPHHITAATTFPQLRVSFPVLPIKKGGDVEPNQPPHAAPNSQVKKLYWTFSLPRCRTVLGSFCLQTLTGHNFCIRTPFSTCDLSNCPESRVISETKVTKVTHNRQKSE
jgi:hypothetical protein